MRLALAPVAAALLVVFHLHLLKERVVAATLFEPEVVLRWAGALLLLAALMLSRRLGLSLWHGRGALVFWLMVLLLHSGAAVPVARDLAAEADLLAQASVMFLLPAAVACGVGLLLLAFARRHKLPSRPPTHPLARFRRPERSSRFDDEGGFARLLASLPPPVPTH